MESLHIWSIKHRLITKLITKLICNYEMNLMSLINLSLEHVYCSNLVSNHSLIMLIRFISQFITKLCNLFFILSKLILHAYKILFRCDRFGILNFATKQDLRECLVSENFWFKGHIVCLTRCREDFSYTN